MGLNKCQENASKQFLGFLCTPAREMVISGPPGVGKTFMLDQMINMMPSSQRIMSIMGASPINQIAITATTNKAAEVLQQRFAGKHDVTTIHSFMGIGIKDNYKTGKSELTKTKNFRVIENTLILMDEASMADTPLLKLMAEGTKNCKLVYIGDHCQLAPVSEPVSPVFNSGFLTAQLNTQMRTGSNPALTALNNQLRQTVETGLFKPMLPIPGIIEYFDDSQMQTEMENHFIKQESLGHKILAFTNQRVQEYNSYIRSEKGLPDRFVTGDRVVSNNCIETSSGSRTMIEKEYPVLNVGEIKYDLIIPYYEVTLPKGIVKQPINYSDVTAALRRYAMEKDWVNYFEIKNAFSDLRLTYAATSHKAQGSTYHTVYVDLQDIGTCRDTQQLARLLYVACSRATDRVVFYGQLPYRVFGT